MNARSLTSKLLISSLLVAGAVALAPKAMAEDVIFSGTVTESCVFSNNTAGSLGADATTLSSTNSGGISATVDLTCNTTTGNVTIQSITDGNSTAATSTSATVTGASVTMSFPGTVTASVNQGKTPLTVDMTATFSNFVPAGSYTYTVVLLASPN